MAITLYIITWITDFVSFLVVFTVSRQLAELQIDPLWMGVAGGAFFGANVVCNTLSGGLSDRIGRPQIMLGGLIALGISILMVWNTQPGHWNYFVAYGVCGGSLGIVHPPTIAWLTHNIPEAETNRRLFRYCLAWNLGLVCGQIVGGWLFENWGASMPLVLSLALVPINLLLVLVSSLRYPAPDHKEDVIIDEDGLDPARSATFARLCWIANLAGTASFGVVIYFFPYVAVDLGISADAHGVMLAVNRMVVVCTYFLLHVTTFWQLQIRVALGVQVLGIGGLICLWSATHVVGLVAGLVVLGLMMGHNYYASIRYSSRGSDGRRKGTWFGMNEASLALGFTVGSLGGGLLASLFSDPRLPFLTAAVFLAVLAAVQGGLYWVYARQGADQIAPR